jgi:undecaprenyl-diphosphatase
MHADPQAPEIVATEPGRVARAPSDVLRLAVAVAILALTVGLGLAFGGRITADVAHLLRGLDILPTWFVTALVLAGQVLGIVVLGGGLVLALWRRNWFLIGAAAAAGAVASGLLLLLRPLLDDTAHRIAHVSTSWTVLDPGKVPTAAELALVAAVVTTAAPWVARRWRRAGWTLVVLMAGVRFLGAPVTFDTIVALLAGWTAGAATVVLLGAPSRRPAGASIAAGLAAVGVPLARLEQASLDARGSTPYFATTTDGAALFVKALGEDERSADLMFRLYRRVQPKDLGDEKPFSTLRRAVEHEALVALAAHELGVQTPTLVAFAGAEPNGFVLAYEAIAGRSLDRLADDEMTDDVLAQVWAQLALLRSHRIAHRDLRLANVFLDDEGQAWIIDFGFSELVGSDLLLATDLAEFLASSTTKVGVDRAVAAGLAAVGPDLVTALDRLHLPMLSGATRTALKESPGTLDELRSAVSRAPAA